MQYFFFKLCFAHRNYGSTIQLKQGLTHTHTHTYTHTHTHCVCKLRMSSIVCTQTHTRTHKKRARTHKTAGNAHISISRARFHLLKCIDRQKMIENPQKFAPIPPHARVSQVLHYDSLVAQRLLNLTHQRSDVASLRRDCLYTCMMG